MPVHSYTPPAGAETPVVCPDPAAAAIVGAELPTNGEEIAAGSDIASLPARLAEGGVPLSGPALFEYRRKLWCAGQLHSDHLADPSSPSVPSSSSSSSRPPLSPALTRRLASLERLDAALSVPRAEESDQLWHAGGLKDIHRSLTDGKRLAMGMRLGLVIKILRAGWVQDGTWPTEAEAKNGRRRAVDAPYDAFWD